MLISFCIPTYNRKEYLEELLNSINNQEKFNLDIEICISDNASTDGTEEMIDVWRNNYNFPIIYRRNSVNLG
ncbi:glycosyltransferase family 2 protein, partial [Salmonella enterica subsp. enterica serovar 4,[5],12:i:-]|nr:glycosyltransferase family 2 protein [Salmonella enterica subsp. enterica serovar 4,[5],12:i:-]